MGTFTLSITTNSSTGGIPAGTLTHSGSFSDAGLVSHFGVWLSKQQAFWPSSSTATYVPGAFTGANLNTAFQAWAAAFASSTRVTVTQSEIDAAAVAAANGVTPVS